MTLEDLGINVNHKKILWGYFLNFLSKSKMVMMWDFKEKLTFFYISHRPNKNQHQQYQIQIFHPTMYFWILQPWNCKSVNPFFTTLVWRKEKGVCINFTKIASNEVVTQKFDCHQQLSSTKVCLWKKWTIFFHFCDNQTFGWRFHLTFLHI